MSSIHPKLSAVIVGTNNLSRAKNFYSAVFGIKINHEDDTYISAFFEDGTHLEIEMINEYRFQNWERNNIGTYKNTEFSVPNIFDFFKLVVENGGTIVNAPILRPWNSYAGEIKDFDGNTFLITQKN